MLKHRLIAGFTFAGISLISLLFPGVVGATIFALLCLGLVWVVMGEFSVMAESLGSGCQRFPLQTAGALMLLAHALPPIVNGTPLQGKHELGLLFLFILVTAVIAVLGDDLKKSMAAWLTTLAGMGLLYGTLRFVPALYFRNGLSMDGRLLVLFLIGVTKFADIGAYTLGLLTARRPQGNHKLWPRLSPKKSWEGLFGGVIASILVAWLFLLIPSVRGEFPQGFLSGLGVAALAAVVLTLTGLLGDLTESALKRASGVKDSGNIPGLGGVFDFVDSLLFNAPLFYLLVVW